MRRRPRDTGGWLCRLHHNRAGGALLEGLLAAPLLTLVLAVLTQMAWIFWAESITHHAAARAVRAAVVMVPLKNNAAPLARGAVQTAARDALRALGPQASESVRVSVGQPLPDPRTSAIELELTVDFPLRVPFARSLMGERGARGGYIKRITVTARLPNEGIRRRPRRL